MIRNQRFEFLNFDSTAAAELIKLAWRAAVHYGIGNGGQLSFSFHPTSPTEPEIDEGNPGNNLLMLCSEKNLKSCIRGGHSQIHRLSGKKWVLQVEAPHVTKTLLGAVDGFDTVLGQFFQRYGLRAVIDILETRTASSLRSELSESTNVIVIGTQGISVCSSNLPTAFSDLYVLDRFLQANYLAQNEQFGSSFISAALSAILQDMYSMGF